MGALRGADSWQGHGAGCAVIAERGREIDAMGVVGAGGRQSATALLSNEDMAD